MGRMWPWEKLNKMEKNNCSNCVFFTLKRGSSGNCSRHSLAVTDTNSGKAAHLKLKTYKKYLCIEHKIKL